MKLSFVVPGNPVPCARARVTRRGTYTPNRTSSYERHVGMMALAARQRYGTWDANAPRYAIALRFFRDSARRADFDNLAKAVTDPMIGVIYQDDSRIVRAFIEIEVDRQRPRVEVDVEVLQ